MCRAFDSRSGLFHSRDRSRRLERFVFVISILEEQSDEECAILLRCSRRDVMIARLLALKRQSSSGVLAEEIL
jgi:hypothetical protein